jgi:cardiolipin synthase
VVARGPTKPRAQSTGEPGDVYSVANVVTVLRLLITPVFFTVLVMRGGRYGIVAFALFVFAAATDFLDGLIARRTGHVTELGKVIDPLVDRLLIAFGVLGLYLLDRLPLWIVAVLIARDGYLLYGAWILERHHRRMSVLYIGKVTTAILLTAFAALILGPVPVLPGGVTPLAIGTVLVYAGLVLSLTTAVLYTVRARRLVAEAKATAE